MTKPTKTRSARSAAGASASPCSRPRAKPPRATCCPIPGLRPSADGVATAQASDVLLVSYANGLRLSLRAARRLAHERGWKVSVLDLRWLAPLPIAAFVEHAEACGRVVVVDECRATGGGIADALIAHLAERGSRVKARSVRGADCYVPLGSAASAVLVGEEQIIDAVKAVMA
jgi:2-oxoisovalerate dehydrogenase E1 component